MDRFTLLEEFAKGPATASEIAERTKMRQAAASNGLRRFKENGYLKREKLPRRTKPAFLYSLTPRGRLALETQKLPAEMRLVLWKMQNLKLLEAWIKREKDPNMVAWLLAELRRVVGEIRTLAAYLDRFMPTIGEAQMKRLLLDDVANIAMRKQIGEPSVSHTFRHLLRIEQTLFRINFADTTVNLTTAWTADVPSVGFIPQVDGNGRMRTTPDGVPEFGILVPGTVSSKTPIQTRQITNPSPRPWIFEGRAALGPNGGVLIDAQGGLLLTMVFRPAKPEEIARTAHHPTKSVDPVELAKLLLDVYATGADVARQASTRASSMPAVDSGGPDARERVRELKARFQAVEEEFARERRARSTSERSGTPGSV